MSDPKQRTSTRNPDGIVHSVTKPKATPVVLPVVNPLDLWYLCEKASFAKATPYRRAKDGYPMYQRTVSQLVRYDNEAFSYRFPYCGEVGFDMSQEPPQPLMSKREPHRPSRFPLSQYQQLRNRYLESLASMRVSNDLMGKTDLEDLLSSAPSSNDGMLWMDGQKKRRVLLRIPDILRLRSYGNPGKPQYSQGNLMSVIEMKFPGDALSKDQIESYTDIAGDFKRLRLLETKRCDSCDKEQWREWIRASESEPVYKPVGQALSLASRASAARHKLLIGHIDAEHAAARSRLEIRPLPLGIPVMTAAPDQRAIEAQNRRAVAGMEMTLAAPFVAVGAAIAAMAAAPTVATVETATLVANAGGHAARFKPFITAAAKRVLAGGALGAGAATPAFAQPISSHSNSNSNLSAEEQETLAHWAEWNQRQQHQQTTVQNYVFWEDAPEISHD